MEDGPNEGLEGETMPLTENQMVIERLWKMETGLVVAVEEAL
jgi:hypothetical protein